MRWWRHHWTCYLKRTNVRLIRFLSFIEAAGLVINRQQNTSSIGGMLQHVDCHSLEDGRKMFNSSWYIRKVWRSRKSKQWPKEKVTTIYKTLHRNLMTEQMNPTCKFRCSGRVNSSCSTCDTHRITLVTNPVTSHEWEKDRIVNTTQILRILTTTNFIIFVWLVMTVFIAITKVI